MPGLASSLSFCARYATDPLKIVQGISSEDTQTGSYLLTLDCLEDTRIIQTRLIQKGLYGFSRYEVFSVSPAVVGYLDICELFFHPSPTSMRL